MDQDNRKKNATKHYQNSDYPSGSFEAAINADHEDRMREPHGLRLERHPLAPGNSGADIEEMVPAFMHRDFFRSEEDAVEGAVTPSSRLRQSHKEVAAPIKAPSSYQEPPNTEEDDARAAAPPVPVPIPVRPGPPRTGPVFVQGPPPTPPPLPDREIPTPIEPSRIVATDKAEGPLTPLRRGGEAPVAADLKSPPAPPPLTELRSPQPDSRGPEPEVAPPAPPVNPPPVGSAAPARGANAYSLPMLVALALVLGIFVWREQTRPVVVAQQPLAVPKVIASPAAPTPMAEPTPAAAGFRPTFLAVGPPLREGQQAPDPSASPAADDPGSLMPGDETEATEESQEDSASRAAILEHMSQGGGDESEGSSSNDPAGLFPVSDEEGPAPKPDAPVRVKTPARPSAPASVAAKAPAPKAALKEPLSTATAADLFPIDEEVPIRPASRPKTAPAAAVAPQPQPQVQPQVQAIQPAPAPITVEGYQIDEPSL